MSTIIVRSAESVHWYRRDGTPQYTVKGKNGQDRPTTLRDARTMDLVPSVTTILKVMAKPGLEQWKLEQMLLAALTLPRLSGESETDYIHRIVHDSKESARAAADKGTYIHESIESHLAGKMAPPEHRSTVMAFQEEISAYFEVPFDYPWITEAAFASPLGFGGKVDIHSTKVPIVIDTKTKDFGPDDKVDAYDEHLMQLAAYRHGLEMPEARCANVFVSRTHPGLIRIIEWNPDALDRGWEMFKHLLQFWKLKNCL